MNMKVTANPNNKSTGYKNISYHARYGKYMVRIKIDGKYHYVGYYASLHDAIVAHNACMSLITSTMKLEII